MFYLSIILTGPYSLLLESRALTLAALTLAARSYALLLHCPVVMILAHARFRVTYVALIGIMLPPPAALGCCPAGYQYRKVSEEEEAHCHTRLHEV